MKLKERLKNVKFENFLIAAAIFIIGLMFVIFPERSASVVCYIVGAVLCVVAVMNIVIYFVAGVRRGSNELITGICFLAGALVLFIKPLMIAEIITVIFGIALIAGGAMRLQLFFGLSGTGEKSRWAILAFAILSLVLGAIMAFDPFSSHTYLMIYAGISLMVYGVLDIISEIFFQPERETDESKVIDIDD